jgi:hypothetical protein
MLSTVDYKILSKSKQGGSSTMRKTRRKTATLQLEYEDRRNLLLIQSQYDISAQEALRMALSALAKSVELKREKRLANAAVE